MKRSSEIDDFLGTCEKLVSRAAIVFDSPKEFAEATTTIKEHLEANWVNFSNLLRKLKDENNVDESLKKRINDLMASLSVLENKAHIKNDWVNEFKQYIINSDN